MVWYTHLMKGALSDVVVMASSQKNAYYPVDATEWFGIWNVPLACDGSLQRKKESFFSILTTVCTKVFYENWIGLGLECRT